jgi:ubiquinone/menaquinone biosynthesis C-methylase UbiE
MSNSSLVEHYARKYRLDDASQVQPVPVCKWPRDRFQMSVALTLKKTGGRYLEIGAGCGNCALTVLDHFDELVLTELSEPRVRQLQRLFANCEKVRVLCNDIEMDAMPFPDSYFDTIVMAAVIEHLTEPIQVLRNLHRLLAPGGRLIIDTPNIAKWTRRIKLAFGHFPSTASIDEGLLCYDRRTPTDLYDEGHFHYFTFRSLGRLCLERVGFSRAERCGYGVSWLCRQWPEMFSEVALIAYK